MFLIQGSEPLPYLVDLTCYGGIGQCNCPDFRTRKQPRLEEGERLVELRCRHITLIRKLHPRINQLVQEWIEAEREP
jgi:hypothetical protein